MMLRPSSGTTEGSRSVPGHIPVVYRNLAGGPNGSWRRQLQNSVLRPEGGTGYLSRPKTTADPRLFAGKLFSMWYHDLLGDRADPGRPQRRRRAASVLQRSLRSSCGALACSTRRSPTAAAGRPRSSVHGGRAEKVGVSSFAGRRQSQRLRGRKPDLSPLQTRSSSALTFFKKIGKFSQLSATHQPNR